jgi:uncharacterized protein
MLADRIDGAQLAQLAERRAVQSAELGAERLPRLAGMLSGDRVPGRIEAEVAFAPAKVGLARLRLSLNGPLELVCQRCLGPLIWPARLDASLAVVAQEADADALEDPFEAVALDDGVLCLSEVIEDEILAAVPLAPRHTADDKCDAPAPPVDAEEGDAGGSSRPFAELGALMKAGQRRSSQN